MSAAGVGGTVRPTASAAASAVGFASSSSAAAGRDGNDGNLSGLAIEAKSSSNILSGHVLLGILKRWHQIVFSRAQRHQKRGKTKCLQAAAVAKSLLSSDPWVKRLRVAGKLVDKGMRSRVIGMAVKILNDANAIKLENIGAAEGRVADLTEELVHRKNNAWRISLAEQEEFSRCRQTPNPLSVEWGGPFLFCSAPGRITFLRRSYRGRSLTRRHGDSALGPAEKRRR